MTTKGKAIELVEKMAYGDSYDEYHKISFYTAKKCALILVDEILSFIEDDREVFNWKDYYKEVKQEIEKL